MYREPFIPKNTSITVHMVNHFPISTAFWNLQYLYDWSFFLIYKPSFTFFFYNCINYNSNTCIQRKKLQQVFFMFYNIKHMDAYIRFNMEIFIFVQKMTHENKCFPNQNCSFHARRHMQNILIPQDTLLLVFPELHVVH